MGGGSGGSGAPESFVAEHFQPVGVRLPGKEFGRTPADPLGSLAAREAAVVQEELEQRQIVRPQMAAEKEVVAQPAVEVFDDATGADRRGPVEWVGGCGMGGRPGVHDGPAYGRLLGSTYAAVKQVRPDATIVGIGGEYGPSCAENILGAVRTAGPDAMDAWSIHPYRFPNSPETSDLVGEVTGIARKVVAAGVKSKAWVTEIGYPTHRTSGGCDEATQARYCVRTLDLLQATRAVEKVFWYDLKDDGPAREYNEHNFGLVHHQRFHCAPKPGIVAMSVFLRHTGGATFEELRRDGTLYCARYRLPDGRDLLLAWTDRGARRLSLAGRVDSISDMMGAALSIAPLPEATENPIYIVGKELAIGK